MDTPKQQTLLICPLTADTVEAMRAEMLQAASDGAQALECRLDYLAGESGLLPTEDELNYLLSQPPCPVIVTCRPASEGGQYVGEESPRLAVLKQAGAFENVLAIDIELDTHPMFRPSCKAARILSHHDFQRCPKNLSALVDQIEASQQEINKIVCMAAGPEDALRVLDEARRCTKPTIALAMGEAGVASRILARKVGAWGTFAALDTDRQSAPGQPTLKQMHELYRWDHINAETEVYGVIGCPIAHSMSPAIHNAAFAKAGVNGVYLPLRVEPGPESFARLLDAIRQRPSLGVRGLSVTLPHKENALAYVGAENCDELSRRIGAINTIRITPDGLMQGLNTDYAGALDALCQALSIPRQGLQGKHVAVLGAGGVSRALVAALVHYGCLVTVYNRTLQRAEQLAEEFGCQAAPLDQAAHSGAEILINGTAVGMHPHVNESPLPGCPTSARIVFDTIYNPAQTRLLAEAAANGRRTVSGLSMFVNQAVAQFNFWMGSRNIPAPVETMRDVVHRAMGL